MAIRKQHGKVSSIAKLAKLSGQSLAARRDYERRDEAIQRYQELQRQDEIRQYEADARIKRDMMAMDWENQKLALRSQHDFAMEEMKRETLVQRELARQVKKMNEYDLAKDKLNEHLADRNITQEQYNSAMANLDMKLLGAGGVIPRASQSDPIDQLIGQYMGMQEPTGQPTPDELRAAGTREAYETGKRLGYWN
jgi:hypothetical protein